MYYDNPQAQTRARPPSEQPGVHARLGPAARATPPLTAGRVRDAVAAARCLRTGQQEPSGGNLNTDGLWKSRQIKFKLEADQRWIRASKHTGLGPRDQQGPSIEGEILTVMIRKTILDRRGGSENKG